MVRAHYPYQASQKLGQNQHYCIKEVWNDGCPAHLGAGWSFKIPPSHSFPGSLKAFSKAVTPALDQSLLTREMFAYVLDAPAVMKDLRKLLTPEQK